MSAKQVEKTASCPYCTAKINLENVPLHKHGGSRSHAHCPVCGETIYFGLKLVKEKKG